MNLRYTWAIARVLVVCREVTRSVAATHIKNVVREALP